MLSFTLVILKDTTLLDSIADFTTQKITWPAQNNKIKKSSPEYFSTKIHTSKKIETDVKVYCTKRWMEDTKNVDHINDNRFEFIDCDWMDII